MRAFGMLGGAPREVKATLIRELGRRWCAQERYFGHSVPAGHHARGVVVVDLLISLQSQMSAP